MKYNLKNTLLLSYIIMTFTILSCVPAYSLTNNDTDAKLETANPQKLDSAMPVNRTAGLQNPDLVIDISTSCSASIDDIDGDKIPNDLEVNGIDINNDNIIDLDLKKLGASPFHK